MRSLRRIWRKHKIELVIVGCIGFIGYTMFLNGGLETLQKKSKVDNARYDSVEDQTTAEQIFNELGCTAQFLNRDTKTTGLTEGALAIDPQTGVAISGGYLCSNDGGIWQVLNDGTVKHIGTSPKIRMFLVKTGFQTKALEMLTQAQRERILQGNY